MKNVLKLHLFIFLLFTCKKNFASVITFDTKDAVVWLPAQTISGKFSGAASAQLIVHHDETLFTANTNDDSTFSFSVILHDAENKIWVSTADGIAEIISDTLNLTLGYHPLPVVKPFAVVDGDKVTLHAIIIDNPFERQLNFFWSQSSANPEMNNLVNKNDSVAIAEIPLTEGIYYFDLLVTAGNDSAWFKTFVTRKEKRLHAFDMGKEHAVWIDNAIVYEITPSRFIKNATYNDITPKLPELKKLGINTIWLQPVFKSKHGGQGYDVTDYFSLREDLGGEQQLKHLVSEAKSLQMHVLFDFVPNHTSIYHPYAQDCIKYGKASHYYNFYQRENDGVKYSSYYKKDKNGFINYFWSDLVNLNYSNPEVQQWIIEACKYWIKELDIDGYRFDAVWGVNARAPSFGKRLQIELKSIKPDLLLLAEDKGSEEEAYKKGFDAAYDWTTDTSWVSQWSWQQDFKSNTTIFNFSDVYKRGAMLRKAIFYNSNASHLHLRFIENNDLPRFITGHSLKQTKMAAALVFSLPGIPMLYNGQERGFRGHQYSNKPVFVAKKSIRSLDSAKLFDYYKKLIQLRKQYSSLRDTTLEEVPVSPDKAIVALHRWKNNEHFIIIINLDSIPAEATIDLDKTLSMHSVKKHFLKDVLTNTVFKPNKNNFSRVKIPVEGYGVRWLLMN